MENEIRILEKPDSVSWDEIHNVIQMAHQQNIQNGIVMKITLLSAEELKQRLGDVGKCFVAMDCDKVVGIMAYHEKHKNKWYMPNGKGMELTMVAILPEYRKKHIFTGLFEKLIEDIKEQKAKVLVLDTPEKNIHEQKIYLNKGFWYVEFFRASQGHFSVEMIKYLDKRIFSKTYCKYRFLLSKIKTRWRSKMH